jgi:glycosyltransferase involved in cell wall biosynthesis
MSPPARCCIYIPCYNAARWVARTVGRIPWTSLPGGIEYWLLFVDNASTDGTWAEIERLRAERPASALRHPVNRGYGGSVKAALDYCGREGFDLLVVLHADGQYAPEELPRLVRETLDRPAVALHFGSRLTGSPLKGGMPFYKLVANYVLSALQNQVLGTRLSEFHSGYRLYRVGLVNRVQWQKASDGFVFDNEIIFLIRQAGLEITESTVPTFYGEEESYVPKLGTPVLILANLVRYILAQKGWRRDPLYSR